MRAKLLVAPAELGRGAHPDQNTLLFRVLADLNADQFCNEFLAMRRRRIRLGVHPLLNIETSSGVSVLTSGLAGKRGADLSISF
jgi:hypothetical protein